MPERLAEEVHRAALPRAAEHLRDRGLEPGVRVGDDQLHPRQATLDQAAEEAAPEGFGLGLADIQADHFTVAGLVHRVGEHERLAHDPAAVADLLDLRIKPQVRVATLERPAPERLNLLIQPGADP